MAELVERDEGPGDAARKLGRFLFSFKGRSGRLPHALVQVALNGGALLYMSLYVWPSLQAQPAGGDDAFALFAVMWPPALGLPITAALATRRAHDLGFDFFKGGRASFFSLRLLFDKGEPGENRFGPPPGQGLRNAEGSATQKP